MTDEEIEAALARATTPVDRVALALDGPSLMGRMLEQAKTDSANLVREVRALKAQLATARREARTGGIQAAVDKAMQWWAMSKLTASERNLFAAFADELRGLAELAAAPAPKPAAVCFHCGNTGWVDAQVDGMRCRCKEPKR